MRSQNLRPTLSEARVAAALEEGERTTHLFLTHFSKCVATATSTPS